MRDSELTWWSVVGEGFILDDDPLCYTSADIDAEFEDLIRQSEKTEDHASSEEALREMLRWNKSSLSLIVKNMKYRPSVLWKIQLKNA